MAATERTDAEKKRLITSLRKADATNRQAILEREGISPGEIKQWRTELRAKAAASKDSASKTGTAKTGTAKTGTAKTGTAQPTDPTIPDASIPPAPPPSVVSPPPPTGAIPPHTAEVSWDSELAEPPPGTRPASPQHDVQWPSTPGNDQAQPPAEETKPFFPSGITSKAAPHDLAVIIGGGIALLAIFLPWVSFELSGSSLDDFGFSSSISLNALDDSLFPTYTWVGLFGGVLALLTAARLFANLTMPTTILGFTIEQIQVVMAGFAALLVISFLIAGSDFGFGFFISLLATAAFTWGTIAQYLKSGQAS